MSFSAFAVNPKPLTVPSVRDWRGGEGVLKVVELKKSVDAKLVKDASLGEEGYKIVIGEKKIKVSAQTETGLFYAAVTLKQMMKSAKGELPRGTIVDVPRYKVRGFVFDVGRLPVALDFLYEVVDVMSAYKMNDLQLHLNDNYIWHEDYVKEGKDPLKESYAAFRLESKIPGLTAKDVSYSKKDFAKLVNYAAKKGVRIVPEFDSPGHALALTRVRPDLIYQGPMPHHPDRRCEMIDAAKPEALDFVCSIYDEFWPTFKNCEVVHVGADEFFGGKEDYRKFLDGLLAHVQKNKHTPRVWGSLRAKPGNTPVRAKGVQMNIWSRDWGRAEESIAQGYDIINTSDRDLYFVPTANYYRMDRNLKGLWEHFKVNQVGPELIDADHPQLLGASWACWNDMIGPKHNGYTYRDLKEPITAACGILSDRMWGNETAPRSYEEQVKLLEELK